jgi:hypothetical protein
LTLWWNHQWLITLLSAVAVAVAVILAAAAALAVLEMVRILLCLVAQLTQ